MLKPIMQILIGAAIVTIVGCGSGNEPKGDIEMLTVLKDSLRQAKNDISVQINEIEEQLKVMDTSGNHNIPIVAAAPIVTDNFRHYFEVQGIVQTDRNAEITSGITAKIMRINVREGDVVKKGKVLMRLDNNILVNNIAELKTQLELAETIYEKQKSLWDQNIGTEIQYLEAKTNVQSLKNKLNTMYAQLDLYDIKAPFSGTVDDIFPNVGEMASPMMPVVRLVNLNDVYIKADVSERYLNTIKVGDTAMILFPSLKVNVHSKIVRIGSFINPNNRTFKVRFELKNQKHNLKSNLLAKIRIMDYFKENSIIISTKLIQVNPSGEEFVFLLKENGTPRVEKRMIKSGVSYQGKIEVLEGLVSNEKIITKGGRNVKDGEIVEVVSK